MHETRIASFGSVASVVGSGAMFTDGFLEAAALLLVVGVLAALAGLHFAGVKVKARLTPSSSAGRRVATIAVVGLVISTAAIGGLGGPASPVGTAEAGYFDGCEVSDSLTLSVASSLGLSNQDCAFWTPDTNVEEISNTDANASAESARFKEETFFSSQNNFAQDARSVAWAKAKISIINDLNNNVSKANARENATQVVQDYYATREKNLISYYEGQSEHMAYLVDTNSSVELVDPTSFPDGVVMDNETGSVDVELVNGETVHSDSIAYAAASESAYGSALIVPFSGNSNKTAPDGSSASGASLDSANSVVEVNGRPMMNVSAYSAEHSDLRDQSQQVVSNVEVYTNETYQAYSAGEIDSTDLASADPTTIGTQASTDYNSTGYYGMANSQLAALGLSGNETISHVVNTTDNGSARQIEGTLFYTGEDSQTFETGTTYDPANLNGSVYMSVASLEDGSGNSLNHSGGFYYVEENFTVSSATDTNTGEAVNTTTMETRDYTSTNVSLLAEEIDRLKEQRAYYEEQQAAGSGGISLDFGGIETGAIIALLAVAFLATRN
jgi:hypothetical protein